jgi:hypothetical protein
MNTIDQLLVRLVTQIATPFVALLTGVALVYFLWAVYQYIKGSSEGKDLKEARAKIIYGIIGLVIMTCAYALVRFAVGTFLGISGTVY